MLTRKKKRALCFLLTFILLVGSLHIYSKIIYNKKYPEWLKDMLDDEMSVELLDRHPYNLSVSLNKKGTEFSKTLGDCIFLDKVAIPVLVQTNKIEPSKALTYEYNQYAVCIAKPITIENSRYSKQLSYDWIKKSLFCKVSDLKTFLFWKNVDDEYFELLNAKRFRFVLGQEILLFENENVNAIIMYTSPGESNGEFYKKFNYTGKWAQSNFLSNAVVYDKQDEISWALAFYFDPNVNSERAKILIRDFLSKIRVRGEGEFGSDAIVLLPFILKNGTQVGNLCGWQNFEHKGNITVCENL